MNPRRLLIATSLFIVCVTAGMADEFTVIDERSVLPAQGIRFSRVEAAAQRGSVLGTIIEIESGSSGARLDAIAATPDPWRAYPMDALIEREQALGGIAFETAPQAEEDGFASGFQFLRGRIVSWPTSGPVIMLGADGMTRLIELPTLEATVTDAGNQWTMKLGGINTAPRDGLASLLVGPLQGTSQPLSSCPAETVLIPIIPARANTTAAASFWKDTLPTQERLWILGQPVSAHEAIIGRDQWTLLIPPTMPEGDRSALLESDGLWFHVPLGNEIPTSVFAIGSGEWLLRDGQLAKGRPSASSLHRTVVAVDGPARRAWMASLISRSGVSLSDEQVAEILLKRGARDAIELPGAQSRLSAPSNIPGWQAPTRIADARSALLAVNRTLDLALADGTRHRRLRIPAATGTMHERGINPPRAVTDGRIYSEPAANHFWIGPMQARPEAGLSSSLPWLELTLQPDAVVAFLDVYHAENCGFSNHFNLRAYRILGRRRADENWTVLFDIEHETPLSRERLVLPQPMPLSHLRLEVIDPGFLPNMTAARLSEITAWGQIQSSRERQSTAR